MRNDPVLPKACATATVSFPLEPPVSRRCSRPAPWRCICRNRARIPLNPAASSFLPPVIKQYVLRHVLMGRRVSIGQGHPRQHVKRQLTCPDRKCVVRFVVFWGSCSHFGRYFSEWQRQDRRFLQFL